MNPHKILILGGIEPGCFHCLKMVNPCRTLGYNLHDKIAGIIFIARQELPRNIELSPFLTFGQHLRHPSCQNFDIPMMPLIVSSVHLIKRGLVSLLMAKLSRSWHPCLLCLYPGFFSFCRRKRRLAHTATTKTYFVYFTCPLFSGIRT